MSLRRCLDSMWRLSRPFEEPWELIVVDNNSSDSTRQVVEEFTRRSTSPVRYLFEAEQGLSHARNAGLKAAQGELIAFTDDDVLVEENWLAEILKESRSHPDISLFFGKVKASSKEGSNISIKEDDAREVYIFPRSPWEPGHGNNMILRKSLLESVGYFDTTMGAGSQIPSGEDTDYTYRVLRSRQRVLYSPCIAVYHAHERLSREAILQIRRNYAKGRGGFYCKYILRGDVFATKMLYWEVQNYIRSLVEGRKARRTVAMNLRDLIFGFWTRLLRECAALL